MRIEFDARRRKEELGQRLVEARARAFEIREEPREKLHIDERIVIAKERRENARVLGERSLARGSEDGLAPPNVFGIPRARGEIARHVRENVKNEIGELSYFDSSS